MTEKCETLSIGIKKSPPFLEDVAAGKLRYYWRSKHTQTSRFQEGMNPPIISVVRYFTKLFQFRLRPRQEDLKKIKKIVREFDPQEDFSNYAKRWLKANVPKLFLHSLDVEYAWNLLDQVGLREKLIPFSEWMDREPLRSFPVGQGKGRTARDLKIKTLAHDTSDFFAWTVITRSLKGEANFFISRPDVPGESAAHGPGVYTVANAEKGYGSGFSIRMELDPQAREGGDFKVFDEVVLLLNKNAVRVIPESVEVAGLVEFFEMFRGGGEEWNQGVLQQLKRKIDARYPAAEGQER